MAGDSNFDIAQGGSRYRIAPANEFPRLLEFGSFGQARTFVQRHVTQAHQRMQLRQIVTQETGSQTSRLSDDELIDVAARLLLRGVWQASIQGQLESNPIAREAAPPPLAPKPRVTKEKSKDHWIRVKVVDDATDRPIPLVDVQLDNVTRTTNEDGIIERRRIDELPRDLSGSWKDWTARWTLSIDPLSKNKPETHHRCTDNCTKITAESTHRHRQRIFHVQQRQVATGDTLESIAAEGNISVDELAEFNWGSSDAKAVQQALRTVVGCTHRDPDGKGYRFDESDRPGIIYLPSDWLSEDHAVDQEHEIRVHDLVPDVDELRFHYQLDVDEPSVWDDTITLESEDGAYRHEILVKDLKEFKLDWVELVFPAPLKGQRYHLIQDPGAQDEAFYIFESMSYEELYREEAEYVH